VRALVISDTHFGAWTGRDLLREEFALERLAPQLEGIDELIFLGDLFDFLFGSVREAVDSADGLLALIAERLGGKRLVFLAGNHDHHLVHRDEEDRLEATLAGRPPATSEAAPGPAFFQSFLERRLPGVEVEIAYPTYEFGGVLCTHGHYLDPHARLSGSHGDQLLTRTLWAIAAGGPEEPRCIEDYESVTTLLTEWLYVAAQMPHGTHAQQNVFRAAQRAGRFASAVTLPMRGAKRLAAGLRDRGIGPEADHLPSQEHFDAVLRPGGREPRLGQGGRDDRLRPHPPAARRRLLEPRGAPALLEHRLLDLRARPRLPPGLRSLPALRLARHRGGDRRGRAPASAARAARRSQPAGGRARPAAIVLISRWE
jgi:hypothetical protein